MGEQKASGAGFLAGADGNEEATHVGRDRIGEQDGPQNVGHLTKQEDYRDPVLTAMA
ncbi:hypothetical protein NKJ90_31125 [Mesorhizobium sp. M0051]|uniref:hypothetical protein n=1 Tax=Mesorhizobium sp. M0051 TaxID=2956862 RepID=UPI003338F1C7